MSSTKKPGRTPVVSPSAWTRSIRKLSREDEQRLVRQVKAGDQDALDTLVLSHLGFVAKLASRYAVGGAPVEDLFNEGTLGLIEAARRYDPDRELRFLTYAVFWVRRAMLTALKLYTSPIRIPESQRRRQSRGKPRAPVTVRAASKLPEALPIGRAGKLHSEMLTSGYVSLDQNVGHFTATVLGEMLEGDRSTDAEAAMIRRERSKAVENGMITLNDAERFVLCHRFGFDGCSRRTLENIGTEMGVTRERVRQIEIRAREKLGKLLRRGEVTSRVRRIRPATKPRSVDSA